MSERFVGRGEHFRASSWIERRLTAWRGSRRRQAPAVLKRLHEFILDRLPGDHLTATLPEGERVRLSARYRQLAWNPEEYAAFRKAVHPGATVFDVGANLGAYTVLFAEWAGPSGRVFAFEPAPATIEGLRRLVALNGVGDRVEIVAAAMSDRRGTALFTCDGTSGANAVVAAAPVGAPVQEVATESVDAFCADRGVVPDVIKVDVEGSELEVLRGARRTLAERRTLVFLELHPSIWPSRGVTEAAVRAEVAAQRLVAEPLAPGLDLWRTEGISLRLRPA